MATGPQRFPALLGALALLAGTGAVVAWGLRRGDREVVDCPRSFAQTQLAALLLWEDAGGSMAPAPEVRRLSPDDLRVLSDPDDSEACRQLLAALPDTLRSGGGAPSMLGLYQVGDLYIVAVVPGQTREEVDALARGDEIPERPGQTRLYGRDFRLIETYSN